MLSFVFILAFLLFGVLLLASQETAEVFFGVETIYDPSRMLYTSRDGKVVFPSVPFLWIDAQTPFRLGLHRAGAGDHRLRMIEMPGVFRGRKPPDGIVVVNQTMTITREYAFLGETPLWDADPLIQEMAHVWNRDPEYRMGYISDGPQPPINGDFRFIFHLANRILIGAMPILPLTSNAAFLTSTIRDAKAYALATAVRETQVIIHLDHDVVSKRARTMRETLEIADNQDLRRTAINFYPLEDIWKGAGYGDDARLMHELLVDIEEQLIADHEARVGPIRMPPGTEESSDGDVPEPFREIIFG
ncbi:MAG: hypothetical protein M1833_007381 [Piccolia ochrophora]|nr:MAG: hypothetical protein M1833_007381 [Piccolia ochrophora]